MKDTVSMNEFQIQDGMAQAAKFGEGMTGKEKKDVVKKDEVKLEQYQVIVDKEVEKQEYYKLDQDE